MTRLSRKRMRNQICEIFLEKLAMSILLRHVRGGWEFARSFDDYVVAMINEWLSVRVYLINRPTCTEVKNLPVIIRGYSNQVANAKSLRWLMSRSCYYSPRWWRCTFTCASWTSARDGTLSYYQTTLATLLLYPASFFRKIGGNWK